MDTLPIGIGIIGCNEGERLVRCIRSVLHCPHPLARRRLRALSDGSAERAVALGATLVQLDLSVPFTAGRARNAGCEGCLRIIPVFNTCNASNG